MARDWPRLVLAAVIAFAVLAGAAHGVGPAAAQSSKPAKKSEKKAAEAEPEKDEQGQPKKKKQDPAEALKAISAAQKLLESGKADAAVTSLTATLNAGNLPPPLMARALLYRGTAHRQLQKPALAIQDLSQALWLKGGLVESERAEAQRQRSAAYSDAGLGDNGSVASSPRPAGSERIASSESAVTTGSNSQGPAPAQAESGSGWNLFGNLFGGSSTPSPAPPKAAAPTQAKPAVSGWSSSTDVRPTAVAIAPPPAAVPQTVAAPVHEGKFKIQLGLVRSESEAGAIVGRVDGELASVFEARRASVEQTVVGNMGTMYRVRVGPYATAGEVQTVCERLKSTKLDCLAVTQ